MTDSLIDSAFTYLPEGVKHDEIELIKRKLKRRRLELEAVASQYYRLLQRTPVVAGTNQSDYFLIERQAPDRTILRIYDPETGDCRLEQQFSGRETKELWLYGLAGNDTFEVKGNTRKDFPIYLISGEGENQYQLNHNRKIHVYDKDYKYDYQKIKYHKISFTPWGIYDSDKGISLGTFFTYTMYGFKRAPFTYQHRIGYNYLKGFMYAGVFPNYDGRRRLYLNASISSPRNFENFFGFGNNTAGYKEEKKNYAIFLVKSATLTIPRRGLAIVQGLTNNGEKIQERVDRILDEDKKPAGKIQLFIAGILTVMCLCSFMTIFVYSATQEQDVPAQDNTFTEGEWDYFYGEDVSMGDASLDFSKSTILFESKQGEITPVFQSNLMNNGSDKGQKKAQQKRCNHVMEEGTLKIHKSKKKGCHIEAYEAQRCKKCGIVKKNQLSYDTDYVVCSHAKK